MQKQSFGSKITCKIIKSVVQSKFVKKKGGPLQLANKMLSLEKPKYYNSRNKITTITNEGNYILEKLELNTSEKERIIFYIHGGAFQLPMSNMYRKLALDIAKKTKSIVYNIDYRVAPDNKFPTQIDDVIDAYKKITKDKATIKHVTIMGDSAGGNLTLLLTRFILDNRLFKPSCVVNLSPWTDLTANGDSYKENVYVDPMFGIKKDESYEKAKEELTKEFILKYSGSAELTDPKLSPIFQSYKNFPNMITVVGTTELLLSDSIAIHNLAKAEGVNSILLKYPKMFHVFPVISFLKESKNARVKIYNFINKHTTE